MVLSKAMSIQIEIPREWLVILSRGTRPGPGYGLAALASSQLHLITISEFKASCSIISFTLRLPHELS
jgi:hypothetical protein